MSNIFPALLFSFAATGLFNWGEENQWKAKTVKLFSLFKGSYASYWLHINEQLWARHGRERTGTNGERGRERESVTKTEKERKRGLGHYHPYYSSLKHAVTETFVSMCVCVWGGAGCARMCACTDGPHVRAAAVPYACLCVLMQKWQKKENNIIGEMYAVIIGIQKMIIHIKQGAQSQPHLHVLDYMHFKSNFRRAYEWH